MASYEEIHGKRVETFSSDPTLDSSYEGQVWFNSTSGVLKSVVKTAAWRSGNPILTSGYGAAGSGSLTAGLIAGRNTLASGDTPSNATEEWNGTGWGSGGNLSTARYYGGALGTQTASLITGGDSRPPGSGSQTTTENYNGTSWTSGTAYPVAVTLASGFGTTSAGVMCNGSDTTYSATTKEYNGSWTAGGDLSTARRWIATAGTQTAGLAFGGQVPPSGHSTNVTEAYDGSSWTSGGSLNVTRAVNAVGGGINQDASQTNALASGGYQSSGSPKTYFNETEAYDGTSWTAQPTMTTARGYGTGGGTGTAGIVVGAYTGSLTTAVEEFDNSVNTITAAAFSTGGAMGNGRYGGNFFGSGKSSQVACGGQKAAVPPSANNIADSETYNGTTWSEGNNLNLARFNASGTGTETAGLVATGRNPAASPAQQVWYAETEEYDGTSYSEVNNCPEAAYRKCGAGTQTATIIVGGLIPPTPPATYSTTSQEYDGTNWTAGGAAPFKANYMDGVGVTTAAVVFGGQQDPAINNASYDYDGTSWTANNNMNIAHGGQHLVAGTVTDAILAGGGAPYAVAAQAETYDGTSFSTNATLAQVGQRGGKGSTTANAIGCGGYGPGYLTATEEYTVESTAVNSKTLTTS